jgi:hypothetical protein
MKIRIFAAMAAAVCFSASVLTQGATSAAPAVTNADVISLHTVGFTEDFIISKIQVSGSAFSLQIADLVELKKAGISEKVIKAMLEKSSSVPAPASSTVSLAPAAVASTEPRRVEAPSTAKDQCPAIAATLTATPGDTLEL